MEEHIRNTWKLLSSENIIFFNCSVVQWTCCLAIAIRCFFTLSVSSAFLAVLPQGSPGDGHALFGMKRFEAALDADFSHPVLLTEVSSRFLSWKSVCSMWSLSSLSTSKLMLWNCIACGSPLAKDKSFIMVNLALLRLHIIFIGIFFLHQARIRAFSVINTAFSRHVKMVLSKTITSLMIYTELSVTQQNIPSWMMPPEDLNSSNFKIIVT